MADQTVTFTTSGAAAWAFIPKAVENVDGFKTETTVVGYDAVGGDQSVTLDDAFPWDVEINFQNAPPVHFQGLSVLGGGNLYTLLSAQGWTSL